MCARRTDMWAVMNGMLYIVGSGVQWRGLPKDLPPVSTYGFVS
ncbi:transposase [Magnetospira sp. QH-2]